MQVILKKFSGVGYQGDQPKYNMSKKNQKTKKTFNKRHPLKFLRLLKSNKSDSLQESENESPV